MSKRNAIAFLRALREHPEDEGHASALSVCSSVEELLIQAKRLGYDFSGDELMCAFRLDWSIRAMAATRNGRTA